MSYNNNPFVGKDIPQYMKKAPGMSIKNSIDGYGGLINNASADQALGLMNKFTAESSPTIPTSGQIAVDTSTPAGLDTYIQNSRAMPGTSAGSYSGEGMPTVYQSGGTYSPTDAVSIDANQGATMGLAPGTYSADQLNTQGIFNANNAIADNTTLGISNDTWGGIASGAKLGLQGLGTITGFLGRQDTKDHNKYLRNMYDEQRQQARDEISRIKQLRSDTNSNYFRDTAKNPGTLKGLE